MITTRRGWFIAFLIETALVVCAVTYVIFSAPELLDIEFDSTAIENTIVSIMTAGVSSGSVSAISSAFLANKTHLINESINTITVANSNLSTLVASELSEIRAIATASNDKIINLENELHAERLAKQELAARLTKHIEANNDEQ